jgi:hypothetical protein
MMKKRPIAQLIPVASFSTVNTSNKLALSFKKNIGPKVLSEEFFTAFLGIDLLPTMKRVCLGFEEHHYICIQLVDFRVQKNEFTVKVSITQQGLSGPAILGKLICEKSEPKKTPMFFAAGKKYYIEII